MKNLLFIVLSLVMVALFTSCTKSDSTDVNKQTNHIKSNQLIDRIYGIVLIDSSVISNAISHEPSDHIKYKIGDSVHYNSNNKTITDNAVMNARVYKIGTK